MTDDDPAESAKPYASSIQGHVRGVIILEI